MVRNIKMTYKNLKIGDEIKVDIQKIIKYDNVPEYIKLVKKAIKNSEKGYVYITDIRIGGVMVRGWKFDFLGDVFIPYDAIKNVKLKNKSFGDKLLYGN